MKLFAMFETKNKNSITKVKDYILESQRGSGCENFISHASIVDDEDLKHILLTNGVYELEINLIEIDGFFDFDKRLVNCI